MFFSLFMSGNIQTLDEWARGYAGACAQTVMQTRVQPTRTQ